MGETSLLLIHWGSHGEKRLDWSRLNAWRIHTDFTFQGDGKTVVVMLPALTKDSSRAGINSLSDDQTQNAEIAVLVKEEIIRTRNGYLERAAIHAN